MLARWICNLLMATSTLSALQPLQQHWPTIRQNVVAQAKAAILPPLFHRPSIWHGILLFSWLLALGLKGLGHWLLLWLAIQALLAFHQASFIPALHARLYSATSETQQNVLGQALVAQTLVSLMYIALGYAFFSGIFSSVIPSIFKLKGPLLLGISLLCGTLPAYHTMKAMVTIPYLAAKQTSVPPQTVTWVSGVHISVAILGLGLVGLWTAPTQAHVAWLLVASSLTATLTGLLFAGFIQFDSPNPIPLLKESLAALMENRGASLARWCITDGMLVATALWIGPTTAAILALLYWLIDGVLPHAIPEITRHSTPNTHPIPRWVEWAPWGIWLMVLIIAITLITPQWIGSGHTLRLSGVIFWLSLITLLRHWGGHRFSPSPEALWSIALLSLALFYWARPLLGLMTPLCLWTVAWACMHLLPEQWLASAANDTLRMRQPS